MRGWRLNWTAIAKFLKRAVKLYLFLTLLVGYLSFFIPILILSHLTAHAQTRVGIWGEIFGSSESLKRDHLHKDLLRSKMNLVDKTFLALFRLVKRW